MTRTICSKQVSASIFVQIRKHDLKVYFVGLFNADTGAFLKTNWESMRLAYKEYKRLIGE